MSAGFAKLVGSWTLLSWEREFKDSSKREYPVGAHPKGFLTLTRSGRIMDLITASDRESGNTDSDHAALFRTMLAYTGRFRVEKDRLITNIHASWNEAWNGSEQERFYKVDGDRLDIISAWAPHPTLPGAIVRNVLSWKREASVPVRSRPAVAAAATLARRPELRG